MEAKKTSSVKASATKKMGTTAPKVESTTETIAEPSADFENVETLVANLKQSEAQAVKDANTYEDIDAERLSDEELNAEVVTRRLNRRGYYTEVVRHDLHDPKQKKHNYSVTAKQLRNKNDYHSAMVIYDNDIAKILVEWYAYEKLPFDSSEVRPTRVTILDEKQPSKDIPNCFYDGTARFHEVCQFLKSRIPHERSREICRIIGIREPQYVWMCEYTGGELSTDNISMTFDTTKDGSR